MISTMFNHNHKTSFENVQQNIKINSKYCAFAIFYGKIRFEEPEDFVSS